MVILAQLDFANVDVTKLTEVAIFALSLFLVARAFLLFVKNSGESDKREYNALKEMIDLAISYKAESSENREAYRADAAATRAVIQESNDTQRSHTEALNIQTAEIRKVPVVIDLLRTDFKNYQVITADEIEGIRAEMVTFRGEIQSSIENMLTKLGTTNAFVQQAVQDHQIIISKLDDIIRRLPQPPPINVINNVTTAPTEDAQKDAA